MPLSFYLTISCVISLATVANKKIARTGCFAADRSSGALMCDPEYFTRLHIAGIFQSNYNMRPIEMLSSTPPLSLSTSINLIIVMTTLSGD